MEPENAVEDNLEEVVRGMIELTLRQGGFKASLPAGGADVPSSAAVDFRLIVRYSLRDQSVNLEFLLTDGQGALPLERRSMERLLDPLFDNAVADVVQDLAWAMERELASRPDPTPEAPASERPEDIAVPPPSEVAAIPVPADAFSPSIPDLLPEVPPEDAVPPPEEEAEPSDLPEPPEPPDLAVKEAAEPLSRGTRRRKPRGDLTAGGGVFLPLYAAREYFTASAYLEAGYFLPSRRASGGWRLGGVIGVLPFTIEGAGTLSVDNVFVLPSLELGFRSALGGPCFVGVLAGAGPAVAAIRGSEGVRVFTLLPFGRVDIEVGARLSRRIEVDLNVAVLALLNHDGSYLSLDPIWGILPRLSVSMEL